MKTRPVPQFAPEPIGLMIYQNGILTDPDSNSVTLSLVNTDNNTVILPPGTIAAKETTGKFSYTLNSQQTSIMGNYLVDLLYY